MKRQQKFESYFTFSNFDREVILFVAGAKEVMKKNT